MSGNDSFSICVFFLNVVTLEVDNILSFNLACAFNMERFTIVAKTNTLFCIVSKVVINTKWIRSVYWYVNFFPLFSAI